MKQQDTSYHKKPRILNYGLAIILLGAFVLAAPAAAKNNAGYYKKSADFEVTQRNYLKALELYKRSLQINPDYVPALIEIGKLYRRMGALRSAKGSLLRALQSSPRNPIALSEVGILYREMGALEESVQYLARANHLSGANPESIAELVESYLLLGRFSEARKWIQKGEKISPDNPRFQVLKARMYHSIGRNYLARKILKRILRSNPRHYETNLMLAELYAQQKRFALAKQYAEQARKIQPQSPQTYFTLARVELSQVLNDLNRNPSRFPSEEKLLDIIETLENARGYDETYVPAIFLIGKIHTLLPNGCEKAVDFFRSILTFYPHHYQAKYFLGYCDAKQIETYYPELLKKNPNDEITRERFENYLLRAYKSGLNKKILPQVHFHFDRARALEEAHRVDSAIFEYQWTLNLYPEHVKTHKALMNYYRTSGDLLRLEAELQLLRRFTGDVLYGDMLEQLIRARKNKLYYAYGIENIRQVKTPTPVYVFAARPADFTGNYPDVGASLSRKINTALSMEARIQPLSQPLRQKISDSLRKLPHIGFGGYYTGNAADWLKVNLNRFVREYGTQDDKRLIADGDLRYAVRATARENTNGIRIRGDIMDIDTGISFAPFDISANGRGFLRNIALKLSSHLRSSIPYFGRVIKVSNKMCVINFGLREGYRKGDEIVIHTNDGLKMKAKIVTADYHLSTAEPIRATDILKIQTGNIVSR